MQEAGLFEAASRQKLRFDSPRGLLSVEDLWDLPLTSSVANKANLDDIARDLYGKKKEAEEITSFVNESNTKDNIVSMKFDILMYIIGVKKTEAKAASESRMKAETKQKILAIVAQKKDEALVGKSIEELMNLAESL